MKLYSCSVVSFREKRVTSTHVSVRGERVALETFTTPHLGWLARKGQSMVEAPAPRCHRAEIVLTLRGVEKYYHLEHADEPVKALTGVNLREDCDQFGGFPAIRKGEFVVIRGPSGGGKTTLLNIIGTLDAPTKGTVELLGHVIDGNSDDNLLADLRMRNIGFVFQTFNLIATMTALENVELPMTILGNLDGKSRRLRARQLLALVGLRNRTDHLPSELSGGEQQRVTIARSLANNPSLLLLDEPTGDLDTATTIEIMDLLAQLNRMIGTTCVMVTHNPDLECYADRILYVSDGKFTAQIYNASPCRLVLPEYQRYLAERETAATLLMSRETPGADPSHAPLEASSPPQPPIDLRTEGGT